MSSSSDFRDRTEWKLTPAERQRAQRYVIIGNMFANTATFICVGAMMQIFANDVLGYSPKRIAGILALAPVIGILRIPMIGPVRRFGLKRTLLLSLAIRLAVCLVLLVVPIEALTFPLYLVLLMTFLMGQQLGAGIVWQPMMRDLTTHADRGSFFARMRFTFSSVTAAVSLFVAAIIGQEITVGQYKLLLVIAALGSMNQLFWLRKVPTRSQEPGKEEDERGYSLLSVLKSSRLLRLPLLIILLLAFANLPIFVIYLRQMLLVPSNLVAIYVLAVTCGTAFSYLLWGKVADTVGFRPMLIGLLILKVILQPLLLLPVRPLPADFGSVAQLGQEAWLSLALLALFGLFSGAMVAGVGIASTSIQHFHVRHRDSMVALNLVNLGVLAMAAIVNLIGGKLLEDLAIPTGSMPMAGGMIHFDWVKGYLCGFVPALMLIVIFMVRRLPNARPYFGVADFFSSILSGPVRTIAAQRHLYHEDEERREELARWLGGQKNPMVIDPLLELLRDPEYDVRVEAIRGLARTGSPVAAEALLALLADERQEYLADHLAWALGELQYQPALKSLVTQLSASSSARVRAMSARALGKLGDRSAVPHLAARLEDQGEHLQVIASCCRALFRLNSVEEAPRVFARLDQLSRRDEYYELLNVLCAWLHIPNSWLLRSSMDNSIWEMLNEELNRRSYGWLRAREEMVAAFRAKDVKAIECMLQKRLEQHPDTVGQTLAEALHREREGRTGWSPTATLATAWLLFQTP